ncbi:MAG TPA: hypothetical protein VF346_04480 [Bacteroidales bacterium]
MKGEKAIRKDNFSKRKVKVINRDVAVFAFFLLLSFIFWYLNSLGKEIEADIRYQVNYANVPRERGKIVGSSADLNLFLKGPGYSILKLKLSGNKAPVIIDFSKVNYKRAPGGKTLTYFIVTSGLTKSLNVQMRSGCEITSIKPDTLFFTFEKVAANTSFTPDNKSENKMKR